MAFCQTPSAMFMLPLYWLVQNLTEHSGVAFQYWTVGKDHLPWLASSTLPNATQDILSLLCHKDMLLAHAQLGVHWDPPVLFCRAAFQLGALGMSWCLELFLPRCWTLLFLNSMRIPLLYFCSLSRSICVHGPPMYQSPFPSFVSSANFLRVHRSQTCSLNTIPPPQPVELRCREAGHNFLLRS